ncbi:hypothetical protein F4806DRAFT_507663 [Annulohypoxylon nitens]|nr:hypothetical protein F4806DRAFT_507663 [Annulohypoxylon nitens]
MGSTKANYTRLTDFFNTFPDTLAVKRFRDLQIRNLLFYQAELAHLREELEEIEQRDAKSTNDVSERVNFRWTPAAAKQVPFPKQQPTVSSLYQEKILRIRCTLISYNNAVEQYKRLNEIPCPRRGDITAICEWLNRMNLGGAFLAGDVEDVWNVQMPTGEFKPAKIDDFYSFQTNGGVVFRIGAFFAYISQLLYRGGDPDKPHYINTSSTSALDRSISTIIASVFPVIPIVVFYFVERLIVRIGLIIVFIAAFAAILVLGLQFTPDKVLAITTAIAAIQVVYVGTTTDSSNS